MFRKALYWLVLLGMAAGCQPLAAPGELTLTSPAFEAGAPIPSQYTCDGEDRSPELDWTDPPEGTRSFAIIMDDPDAPGGLWVHWVWYDLPAETRGLPAGVPDVETLTDGTVSGANSWGHTGYGGPCPPSGTHRYYFKLYALDTRLEMGPGLANEALLDAMQGHILVEAVLMGTFAR